MRSALKPFADVRELTPQNAALMAEADETTQGPAYVIPADPDGNPILIDQHR